jgi:hypothetical protein
MCMAAVAFADGLHPARAAPANTLCNIAFPGSLKVCHPVGTSPAGVVDLGGGWQFVVLEPFSEWLGVKATTTPAIATFHDGKRVSLDRHIPYFENVQSVLVTISPTGGHFVTIPRCQGSCRLSEMESGVGWGRKVDIRDEALLSRT